MPGGQPVPAGRLSCTLRDRGAGEPAACALDGPATFAGQRLASPLPGLPKPSWLNRAGGWCTDSRPVPAKARPHENSSSRKRGRVRRLAALDESGCLNPFGPERHDHPPTSPDLALHAHFSLDSLPHFRLTSRWTRLGPPPRRGPVLGFRPLQHDRVRTGRPTPRPPQRHAVKFSIAVDVPHNMA